MKLKTKLQSLSASSAVVRRLLIYSGSAFFLKSISFVVLPVLLYTLTPEQYGLYTLSMSFIGIANIVCGLGFRQVIAGDYFQENIAERLQLIHQASIVYLLINVPLLAGLYFWFSSINRSLFSELLSSSQFRIILVTIFLSFFSELLYLLLQVKKRAYVLSGIQLCAGLIIGLGMLASAYSPYKVGGLLAAQCAGTFLPVCMSIYFYQQKRWARFFTVNDIYVRARYLIKRGLPFIYSLLCAWFLALGDRWMLAWFGTLKQVSQYAVADSVSQLFYFLILAPWAAAYQPYILERYATEPNQIAHTERSNVWAMIISCGGLTMLFTGLFFLGRPLAYFLLPAEYHPAVSCMLILLYGQILLLGGYFGSCLIQFRKHGWLLAGSFGSATLANLLLNYWLIPWYGLHGCAIATVLAYALYFAGIWVSNRWVYSLCEKKDCFD